MNHRSILTPLCCITLLIGLVVGLLGIPHLAIAKEKRRSFHFSSYDVHTMVQESGRVFYGEVVRLDYVPRHRITTDITVRIIENIKGHPNAGPNHVKFWIPGGKTVSYTLTVSGTPKFREGEKLFMFLKPHPNLGKRDLRTGRPIQRPYNGLIVGTDGKVVVKDDWVHMPYSYMRQSVIDRRREVQSVRAVSLPVNLVVKMARAAVINAEAVELLDEQLRTFAKQALRGGNIQKTRLVKPAVADLNAIEAKTDTILARNAQQR